jgi:O-acetylhomoserine/O-acetylserine sulfhydrylase-like pyridoxal-dependent enzyme
MIDATGPAATAVPGEPAAPTADYSPGVAAAIERGQARMAATAAARAAVRRWRFDTIAIHGLWTAESILAADGSISEPMVPSTAQHFASADEMEAALAYLAPSWTYARIANPTQGILEATLSLLEGYGTDLEVSACATGSGMSAIAMATQPFLVPAAPGTAAAGTPANIVASAKCYGGTFMLFSERYEAERGVAIHWVRDPLDLAEWEAAIDDGTRLVYGELPSNPGLAIFDVAAVAEIAHAAGLPLIVDSTIATPALLRPLALGADVVVHSLSKAIGGSGLAIGGAILSRPGIPTRVGPAEMADDFATWVKLHPFRDHGPALSPQAAHAFLVDLRTLRPRVDRWSRSTMTVANFLAGHPKVSAVHYPGLASHPAHGIAARDMRLVDGDEFGGDLGGADRRYGHLMGFEVAGGAAAARRFFDGLELIRRATDLGRIRSVATIPAISTHQQQGEAGRKLASVPDNLVRLSIGGEHPVDLIADLDGALARA